MTEKDVRTHDIKIYMKENRYEEPKEMFKVLGDILLKSNKLRDGIKIYDFGCAAGELLYFLNSIYPAAQFYGVELLSELVEKAKSIVPEASFFCSSVLNSDVLPPNSADIAILSGVHSIFDEIETCFGNLINWTCKGGDIYVFGMFNPYPIDVWVRYRLSENFKSGEKELGWNIVSKQTVLRFLHSQSKVKNVTFTPFEMPFNLLPHEDDPVRSWTVVLNDGKRILTNGLSLIINMEVMHIEL